MNTDQLMSVARSIILALLGTGMGALVTKGILTQDEFDTKKAELLKKLI